jgi:hypothetical protein
MTKGRTTTERQTDLPPRRKFDPCVDIFFSQHERRVMLSARRYASDGKLQLPDGRSLVYLIDWDLAWPVPATELGQLVRRALKRSKQLGARNPDFPPSLGHLVGSTASDRFERHYYPATVWTHRDESTPYVIGTALSVRVKLEPVLVDKACSDQELGRVLSHRLAEIARLQWPDGE